MVQFSGFRVALVRSEASLTYTFKAALMAAFFMLRLDRGGRPTAAGRALPLAYRGAAPQLGLMIRKGSNRDEVALDCAYWVRSPLGRVPCQFTLQSS